VGLGNRKRVLASLIKYTTAYKREVYFMKSDIAYTIDTDKISVHKMKFTVTNRRPKFTEKEKDKVKTEIERQLFEVFRKND